MKLSQALGSPAGISVVTFKKDNIMGKVLKILGIIFIVIIVGFVGLMFWAHGEGEEQQARFFAAIASEDPNNLIDMMGDDLKKQVDPPVLRMWMIWVNQKLGKFTGLAASDFNTQKKMIDTGTLVETSGTANFEKGQAKVRLTLLNGKIEGYEVTSDALKGNWLSDPKDDLYRNRAKELITYLVNCQIDQAVPMMHEAILKQISKEDMLSGMTKFADQFGKLKSIEIVDEEFIDGETDKSLVIRLVCQFENGKANAFVRFDFDSARGHILAFKIPAD